MFFKGKAPVTPSLPYEWHDTPNLHFLSILDFIEYCHQRGIQVKGKTFIGKKRIIRIFPNLFALTGIFVILKEKIEGHPSREKDFVARKQDRTGIEKRIESGIP
jgi:hypothetical protein